MGVCACSTQNDSMGSSTDLTLWCLSNETVTEELLDLSRLFTQRSYTAVIWYNLFTESYDVGVSGRLYKICDAINLLAVEPMAGQVPCPCICL